MRAWLLMAMLVGCTGEPTEDSDTGAGDSGHTDVETGGGTDSDSGPPVVDATLVLPEVMVVDAAGSAGPVWVALRDDTIVAITDVAPDAGDAIVLEAARGRVVSPGLIDPHVHLFLSGASGATGEVDFTLADNLRASLLFGVTSVVDAGGPVESAVLRDLSRRPDWQGPSIQALGTFVTVPGGHPCEVYVGSTCTFVDSASDVRAHLEAQLERGLDGVKVSFTDASHTPWGTPRLSPALASAAFGTTLPLTYVHADSEAEAVQALALGADHLAHPPFAAAVSSEGARTISEQAVSVHTTLGAFQGVGDVLDDAVDWEALEPVLPSEVLDDWRAVRDDPALLRAGYAAESAGWARAAEDSVEQLRRAGATLLPASDAGYLFVGHGEGLHRELAAMQDGPWTGSEVLAAATVRAAAAVGWTDRGMVQVGQRADLLVLQGDPTDDVAWLSTPSTVLVGGQPFSRAELLDGWTPLEGGESGGLCLGDCPSGSTCEVSSQTCQPIACAVPFQVDDPCGPDAWCGPELTCRPVRSCDLLDPAGTCEPAWYGEACVPFDRDTAACVPAGPRTEGELCDGRFALTSCEQGLMCSVVDGTCYRLCDGEGGQPGCGEGQACVVQTFAGEDWFGLCL